MNPLVTVLMPVYNGERYLDRAIQSIQKQSYEHYKFLIIDDGSTDSSLSIIERYKRDDPRVDLISNPRNLGLIETLNRGIEQIDTKYVARMDCDDYAHPTRLEKQVDIMEASPSLGACGTWITVKNISDGSEYVQRYPTTHAEIKVQMLGYCAIAHPTVMLRADFLTKEKLRYDPNFIHAEDYELWTRAIERFEFANIDEPLLDYTIHPENVSSKNESIQKAASKKIRIQYISKLITPQSEDETSIQRLFSSGLPTDGLNQTDFTTTRDLLERLVIANKERRIFNPVLFDDYLFNTWYRICKKSSIAEISPTREFIRSKISRQCGWLRFLFLSSKLMIRELGRLPKRD